MATNIIQTNYQSLIFEVRGCKVMIDADLAPYPMRIGIVTSASGAAVKDIADSVYSRWPCAKLLIYPAQVQGKGAAKEIAKAIKTVNKRNSELKIDVLIVGRGGGSMEDLSLSNRSRPGSASNST